MHASDVSFAGLLLDLPADWRDITDEDDASAPWTLALEDGIGAIQFSVALHSAGEAPDVTLAHIEQMFFAFCERHDLAIIPSTWTSDQNFGTGGSRASENDVVGAWYVSDGTHFALVTYTGLVSLDPAVVRELEEAETIAKSIRFADA